MLWPTYKCDELSDHTLTLRHVSISSCVMYTCVHFNVQQTRVFLTLTDSHAFQSAARVLSCTLWCAYISISSRCVSLLAPSDSYFNVQQAHVSSCTQWLMFQRELQQMTVYPICFSVYRSTSHYPSVITGCMMDNQRRTVTHLVRSPYRITLRQCIISFFIFFSNIPAGQSSVQSGHVMAHFLFSCQLIAFLFFIFVLF